MTQGGGETIRVLHVDDNPDWGEIVAEFLEREHDAIAVRPETDATEALERLEDEEIDCVLSDYDMPGMDGLELLQAVRERYPDLPYILFTGKGSEEIASEAVSAGVTEYLQKDSATEQYTLLANRIERAVTERRAREALEESERMLSTLISNLPGMVYRSRGAADGPMEFVSQGCEELTGYQPAVLERGEVDWCDDIVASEDRPEARETVRTALAAGDPFELTYRIRTATDETKWVRERGSGVYEDGELVAHEGFVTDITPRKRREQELRAEREFTESALNALEDVFFVFDPDTESFLRWNDRLNELTGYSDAELASMRASEIVADDGAETVQRAVTSALETGEVTLTAHVATEDGDCIPVEFRGRPLYEDGDLLGIGAVGRDISDRIERERELEQYRTLVENVADPMYILDPDGYIEMVNSAFVDSMGYSREDLEGSHAGEFVQAEDLEQGRRIIAELLESDEEMRTWEMDAVRTDGTTFRTEVTTALIVDDGEFVGSVGVSRDISDRRERERELERLETVVEAVGDPVYALDEDGRFTFVNEAFEQMTGYTREELVGTHMGAVLPKADVEQGRELISSLVGDDGRRQAKYEVEVQPKDGEGIPSELHLALLQPDEGGTAGIIRDIAERKQREERLEEFASVVSHDLRGPLNVILGRAKLARETGDTDQLDAIVDSARRMEELIQDLLALARQGETVGEQSEVDLAAIADRAWNGLETGDAVLANDADGSLEADPKRLQQLLANLLRNAVEHGPGTDDSDGTVTVEVGVLDDGRGFYVADDGTGIPESDREEVFDHGFTTDQDGTGFGLAIVERIADAHGWSVRLIDSESGGARFKVTTA